jgi:hypothetical protein
MRLMILAPLAIMSLAGTTPVLAKGCIRGAVAGGVAGHYVGKGHAIAGATVGCIAAHHYYARQAAARKAAAKPPAAARRS